MRWMIVLVAAIVLVTAAGAEAQRRPRIELTATLERIRDRGIGEARYYLLWNKAVRARPLGHALLACRRVHDSNLCAATYTLPLGKIIVLGETRRLDRYWFPVVGGSRCYENAEPGFVHQVKLGPGTYSLLLVINQTCR